MGTLSTHTRTRRFPLLPMFRWLFSDQDWAAAVVRQPRRTDGIVEVCHDEHDGWLSDSYVTVSGGSVVVVGDDDMKGGDESSPMRGSDQQYQFRLFFHHT